MNDENDVVVEYERQGENGHVLSLGSDALADIRIDYDGIPQDQRGGTANRLLCAAALYCFASTLGSALTARGAKVKSLTGRAISEKGRDDYYRTRVKRINIEIDVDVDEEDQPILEHCEKIVEQGCLITYSLGEGIEVEHTIRRKR